MATRLYLLILILTLVFAAETGFDPRPPPRPSPSTGRDIKPALWNPRRLPRHIVPKAAKRELRQMDRGGSIDAFVRRRNAFLHMVYMASASEVLTQASAFASFLWEIAGGTQKGGRGGIVNAHTLIPVYVIVLVNIGVWLLWEYCRRGSPQSWDGRKKRRERERWFNEHFTCAYDPASKERARRPHTVLTCAFAQKQPGHISGNMMWMWVFGPWSVHCLGSHRLFFYLYVGSIYFAQFFEDARFRWFPEQRRWDRQIVGFRGWASRRLNHLLDRAARPSSLGASGAVSAVLMFSCLSLCGQGWGATALAFALAYTALLGDLTALYLNQRFGTPLGDNTLHGVHVGGYLFGALAWLILFWFGVLSTQRDITPQMSLTKIIFSVITNGLGLSPLVEFVHNGGA